MTDHNILELARRWLKDDSVFANFIHEVCRSLHEQITQEYVVLGRRLDAKGQPRRVPCLSVFYSRGINPGYIFPVSKDVQCLTQNAWFPNSISSELSLHVSDTVLLDQQGVIFFMKIRHMTTAYQVSRFTAHEDELLLLTRDEFETLSREILTESTCSSSVS